MFHDSNRIHRDFEAWLPEINIYAGQTHICCLYKPPLFIASAPTFDYTIAISKCHVSLPLWKPLVSTDDQLINFTPGLFFTSFRNPQVHHFCCLNNKVCKIFMVNQPKKQQKRGRFVSMLFLFFTKTCYVDSSWLHENHAEKPWYSVKTQTKNTMGSGSRFPNNSTWLCRQEVKLPTSGLKKWDKSSDKIGVLPQDVGLRIRTN